MCGLLDAALPYWMRRIFGDSLAECTSFHDVCKLENTMHMYQFCALVQSGWLPNKHMAAGLTKVGNQRLFELCKAARAVMGAP